jgi:branched-chain amino acid transport system substrate-binding protein
VNGRSIVLLFISSLIVSLIAISCIGKAQQPVKIGIILPLTGLHSSFGAAQKKGYDLANEDLQKELGGRKILFVFQDDGSDENKAISAARKLIIDDRVTSLIGSYSSSCTFNAIEIANLEKVPMVCPSAAADMISQRGNKWVFRINAPSSVYARTMVDFLGSLSKVRTLGILYEGSLFGTTTSLVVDRYAREKGMEVVFSSSYDEKELKLLPLQLLQVKKKKPDALIMISYMNDAVFIMQTFSAMDINPRIYLGAGAGFTLLDFINKLGKKSEYVCSVSQWSAMMKNDESKEFVKKYRARYGEMPTFHSVEAYVGAKIMAEAIRRAKKIDNEEIRRSLISFESDTAYGHIKFESFDDYINQNRHTMIIQQIQDGVFMPVWPEKSMIKEKIFPAPPWSHRENRPAGPGKL